MQIVTDVYECIYIHVCRRSRGKKEVKNLLDAGLLAHAFPNVSRVMRTAKVTQDGEEDSDSD